MSRYGYLEVFCGIRENESRLYFLYFLIKTYVVDSHWKCCTVFLFLDKNTCCDLLTKTYVMGTH